MFKLWRFEDAPADDDLRQSYLRKVEECHIFVLIIGQHLTDAVREEFDVAVRLRKPILVFLKHTPARTADAATFIEQLTAFGLRYKRFADAHELRREVLRALCECVVKYFLSAMPRETYLKCLALLLLLEDSGDTETALARLPASDPGGATLQPRLRDEERRLINSLQCEHADTVNRLWETWYQFVFDEQRPLKALPIAEEMVRLEPSSSTYVKLAYTLACAGRTRDTIAVAAKARAVYANRLHVTDSEIDQLRRIDDFARWMARERRPYPIGIENITVLPTEWPPR